MSSTSPTSPPLSLSLVWEIPLAVLSFCLFKIVKAIIGLFYGIYVSRDLKRATQWQILSADVLKIPIALPVLMTKGPRWNTHAIIGAVGPFEVKNTISFDLNSLRKSAQSWTVVVYRYPDYATITQLSSLDEESKLQDCLTVPSGKYSLGVRYYEYASEVEFPTITADSGLCPTISFHRVSAEINQFYEKLCDRHHWFYAALHYYIYTLLQFRPCLPEAFVNREYLPVGNPDTTFFYDYVEAQQPIQLQLQPIVLESYDIYFTLYRRSSLPLFYTKVEQEIMTVPAFSNQGYYLIRARPRVTNAPHLDAKLLQVIRNPLPY